MNAIEEIKRNDLLYQNGWKMDRVEENGPLAVQYWKHPTNGKCYQLWQAIYLQSKMSVERVLKVAT